MKCLIIYEKTELFGKKAIDMINALKKKNISVKTCDIYEMCDATMQEMEGVAFIYCICFPFDYENIERLKSKIGNIKCIIELTRHPCCYSLINEVCASNFWFSGEKTHMQFLKKYYGISNLIVTECEGNLIGAEIVKPWDKRELDVYFPGSREPLLKIEERINQLDRRLQKEVKQIIEILKVKSYLTIEAGVEYVKQDNKNEIKKSMAIYGQLIEKYLVEYFKEIRIKQLARSGIKVSVCGSGWEDFDEKNVNVIRYEGLSASDLLNLYGNSKIVFHIQPWWKSGITDRPTKAWGSGAILLSDHCEWLDRHFVDMQDIVFYDLEMSSVSFIDNIKKILEDSKLAREIQKHQILGKSFLFSYDNAVDEIFEQAHIYLD